MAHSIQSLGVAVDSLAATTQEHGDQISALESAPPGITEAASQPRTFVIGAQGVVIGEMRFVGGWNAFLSYGTQDTVRYKGATYTCTSPVAAVENVLGPLPAKLLAKLTEPQRGNSVLGSAEPGELIEDILEITDPVFIRSASFSGQCHIYQIIGNGEKAVLTNPNPSRVEANAFVHTSVMNESGSTEGFFSWAGGQETLETEVLEAGKKYYLIYYMTEPGGAEGGPIKVPSKVSRAFTVKVEKIKNGPTGNKNPQEDSGHWALIANATPEVAGVNISTPGARVELSQAELAGGFEILPSATKMCWVNVSLQSKAEKEAQLTIEVEGVKLIPIRIQKQAAGAGISSFTMGFPVKAGAKVKFVGMVGEVERGFYQIWTLN